MKCLLSWMFAVALATAWADATVSDVVVNQRWPWNEKIDVDFTLSGTLTDVKVTAIWDGHPDAYELGMLCEAKPGTCRVTWDPAASPFAGKTLTGFSVSVTPVEPPANRYLVIDLVNGGVSYRAQPDGNDGLWSDAYKTTKMVFRRIPAGTYQLGMESNVLARAYGKPIGSHYATAWRRHDVTFTNDFYVGVYKLTQGQYAQLTDTSAQHPQRAQFLSYDALRGSVEVGVNWPKTGHDVAANSLIDKLRTKAGGLVGTIDLCQECQLEAAMRAGTTTIWPNGGTMEDSVSAWTNIVDAIGWRGDGSANKDVGLKPDNGWGIYDAIGISSDWTLDAATFATAKSTLPEKGLSNAVEPVGLATSKTATLAKRVIRGSGDRNLYNRLPCVRQVTGRDGATATARLCVHLMPRP